MLFCNTSRSLDVALLLKQKSYALQKIKTFTITKEVRDMIIG